MINIDSKLQTFFSMVKKLKNKKSELAWKSDKLIHKKDEDLSESIDELTVQIGYLERELIPGYIVEHSEDFKRFFSDEFIATYVKENRKHYTKAGYGFQGIIEDNEYDSYGYWRECASYYKSQKDQYFKEAVGFFDDLEAIYEWKNFDLPN